MNEQQGRKGYEKFAPKAKAYMHNPDKTRKLLQQAAAKANTRKNLVGDVRDKLQLLFGLLRDWSKGHYRRIPTNSIVMIIVAILYFVSPVDLIFDYVPFLGYIDDISVIGFVIKNIAGDLEAYRSWKESDESAAVDRPGD